MRLYCNVVTLPAQERRGMRKSFKLLSPPLLKGDFEDVYKIHPNPPLEKEGIKISLSRHSITRDIIHVYFQLSRKNRPDDVSILLNTYAVGMVVKTPRGSTSVP